MSMSTRTRATVWFLALTFLVNWGMVAIYYGMGGRLASRGFIVLTIAYMLVPALAAIFVQKVMLREGVIGPLGVTLHLNWWWLLAWVLPLFFALATFGVSLLLPGVDFAKDMTVGLMSVRDRMSPEQYEVFHRSVVRNPAIITLLVLLLQSIVGGLINSIFAFGEELGWRGFLLRQFARLGFWRMSALIGAIWGIWHAPLILMGYNYPRHPFAGVGMMVLFTLLFTPLITYIRLRGRSVLPAALMHGTFNASLMLGILFVSGGSVLTVGVLGLSGFIVLLVANLLLVLYDRSRDDSLMRRPSLEAYLEEERQPPAEDASENA